MKTISFLFALFSLALAACGAPECVAPATLVSGVCLPEGTPIEFQIYAYKAVSLGQDGLTMYRPDAATRLETILGEAGATLRLTAPDTMFDPDTGEGRDGQTDGQNIQVQTGLSCYRTIWVIAHETFHIYAPTVLGTSEYDNYYHKVPGVFQNLADLDAPAWRDNAEYYTYVNAAQFCKEMGVN